MSLPFKRALAVGTTAALALISLFILPAHSAPAATPTTCAGVWVVVQNDQSNPASTVGCATTYGTGLDALQGAGFAATTAMTTYGIQLTQIDTKPKDPNYGSNGGFYWSYWHATVNADGTLGAWTYYSVGPADTTPTKGVAEGFMLTNDYNLTPGATRVFTPAASTSPTASVSTSTSASSSAASSTTSSASTTASASASSTITKKAVSAKAVAAGNFINGNLPTADDGAGALINAAFGLTAVDSCAYAPTIRSLVANLKSQASDFTAENPGRAALLAIFASAMGEDPTSFGGVDLLGIVAAGTQADGQVGSYPSAFVQSYAVIAYVRAGKPVPGLVLSNLVNSQDKTTGAFGYDFGGFTPDYDTTGLAIQALHAAGGSSAAIAAAVAWATSQQNLQGYWPNPFSPVDSTGILGSGLQLVSTGTGGALGWIEGQQLADGGFPAQLGDATSNVMATMDALWLITGTSYVTVTFQATGCTSALAPSPAATAATLSSLADTGAPDGSLQVTLFGALVLVTGLALVASRRKVRQP
jgi:hypothetical protein